MKIKKFTKILALFLAVLVMAVLTAHFSLSLYQPLYYLNENMVESIGIYKYKRNQENYYEVPSDDISILISAMKEAKVEEKTKIENQPSSGISAFYKVKLKSGRTLDVKCVGIYCFEVNKKLWRIYKPCESYEILRNYLEDFKVRKDTPKFE